ncbi:MAG TPA: phytase, partial [Acidimicrobiales bacterium]|nr:phytase [Acidimicrobiales bacterium]
MFAAPPEVSPLSLELNGPGTNHDDPCFWVDPHDPTRAMLFATAKDSGLVEVFDLPARTLLGTIPGFLRPNNCWVEGDLLLTTDTLAHDVKLHHLPDLEPAGTLGDDTLRPMGIATLHTPDGRTLLYVTDEGDASVHVYDLATQGLVQKFFTNFGAGTTLRIEPVLADDRYQRLFISREEKTGHGIGLFTPDGTLVREFGGSIFAKDTEGLALYTCGDGGYLLASDQHLLATEFEVFDRVTLDHLGTFTMQDGNGEFTSATDGIEILQAPLPGFPAGMLAACDGCGDNFPDQTDVMAWERIASVVGLDLCPGGIAPDCVSTPCMRRIFPSADASVLRETPDTNAGADAGLVIDASPQAEALLRFMVPDLTGFDVERASLRLTVDTETGADSDGGGVLYTAGDDWDEDTVTWNTRP